jgi:hypothetical protein
MGGKINMPQMGEIKSGFPSSGFSMPSFSTGSGGGFPGFSPSVKSNKASDTAIL